VRPERGDGGCLIEIDSAAGPRRRVVDGEIIRTFLTRGRRSVDLLVVLATNSGRLLTKEHLLDAK
jgi:hypothetical protein